MIRALRPQLSLYEPSPVFSSRALPIAFTILGDTPSKKNSKRLIQVKGRWIPISSKHYEKWQKSALNQIEWDEGPLAGELAVEISIFAGTQRAGDLTNKAESVLDLLVDKHILADDNWFLVPRVTLTFGGVDRFRPRAEVVITER